MKIDTYIKVENLFSILQFKFTLSNNINVKMIKKIILIFSILSFSLSYGQYDWTPGKIVLKNGKTFKGLLKIPMSSDKLITIGAIKVQYKKDKKGKKKKFSSEQVDKIFFGTNNSNTIGYYEYISIPNKKNVLFKLIRNGKVKLYTRTIKSLESTSFSSSDNNSIHNRSVKSKKVKVYYIVRENEVLATFAFNESMKDIKTFKKTMKDYFSDCEDVSSFIDNDLYQDFDIRKIVEDYNLLCK